jgi:hypothetical protein
VSALVHLGDLVDGVHLGLKVNLLVLLVNVVLLDELGSLNLVGGEKLQIALCIAS